jgi:hypothetical protein
MWYGSDHALACTIIVKFLHAHHPARAAGKKIPLLHFISKIMHTALKIMTMRLTRLKPNFWACHMANLTISGLFFTNLNPAHTALQLVFLLHLLFLRF